MKKAKIFLGAITVLAVVGGALAFKAKTFSEAKPVFSTFFDFVKETYTCSFVGNLTITDDRPSNAVGTITQNAYVLTYQGGLVTTLEAANSSCTYDLTVIPED